MDEFRRDLDERLETMAEARTRLLETVHRLSHDDLSLRRRGGWSIRDVLRHVIDSEVAYAKVIGFLGGKPIDLANASDEDTASGWAAATALERVREAMLASLDGVDEATFYDLRDIGREQYSVMSVLENVAMHDHEHEQQIRNLLASRQD